MYTRLIIFRGLIKLAQKNTVEAIPERDNLYYSKYNPAQSAPYNLNIFFGSLQIRDAHLSYDSFAQFSVNKAARWKCRAKYVKRLTQQVR